MAGEILPAVGVALKPQLQAIPTKSLPFEDAEQLMCGNADTTWKGIWEQASALSSGMALEARVAFVNQISVGRDVGKDRMVQITASSEKSTWRPAFPGVLESDYRRPGELTTRCWPGVRSCAQGLRDGGNGGRGVKTH